MKTITTIALSLLALLATATPAAAQNMATGFGSRAEINRRALTRVGARLTELESRLSRCRTSRDATARAQIAGLVEEMASVKQEIAVLSARKSCFELPEGAAQVVCLGTVEKAVVGSRAVGENVLTRGIDAKGKAFKGRMYVGKTDFTPEILMEAETSNLNGTGNANLANLAGEEVPPYEPGLSPAAKMAIMGAAGLAAGLGTGYLIGKDAKVVEGEDVRESTRLSYGLAGGGIGLALGLAGGAVWAF